MYNVLQPQSCCNVSLSGLENSEKQEKNFQQALRLKISLSKLQEAKANFFQANLKC